MSDDAHLDGCDLDFTATDQSEDHQIDALVMFADVWDDPDKVRERQRELVEWDAAATEHPGST